MHAGHARQMRSGKSSGVYSCVPNFVTGLPPRVTKTQQNLSRWACAGQAYGVSRMRLVGRRIGYTNSRAPIGSCRGAIHSCARLYSVPPKKRGHQREHLEVGLGHRGARVEAATSSEVLVVLSPVSQLPPLRAAVMLAQGLGGGTAGCV